MRLWLLLLPCLAFGDLIGFNRLGNTLRNHRNKESRMIWRLKQHQSIENNILLQVMRFLANNGSSLSKTHILLNQL